MFVIPSHFIAASSADLADQPADLPNCLAQVDRLTFVLGAISLLRLIGNDGSLHFAAIGSSTHHIY